MHGLPDGGTSDNNQERALNKLITNLGREAIGDHGITLDQEYIIGAYHIEQSSNKDKPLITRLTVDTNETKEKIQKAAKYARRWGSVGGHTVFLRDTLPEKAARKRGRSSFNEDTKTPKKQRTDGNETPRSSRSKKEKSPPRRRLDWWLGAAQAKVNAENEELEKIRLKRLEARRAKLAHQEREDRKQLNESKTSEPENKKKDAPKAIIQTFQALNENENENKDDWRSPPTKKDTKQWHHDEEPATQEAVPLVESESETETQGRSTHAEVTEAKSESEESIEVEIARHEYEVDPEVPESDFEDRGRDEEELEAEGEGEEEEVEDESVEPSPERKVILRKSKSASRNRRQRRQRKLTRDQETKHVTERIDATHPKMRRGKEAPKNTRKRSRTPSTDILSVDDKEDAQDTKMPKNKKNY